MDLFDHDLERGMRRRREILGDAWVDRSVAETNTFTADFQSFLSRYAWHEVWDRPGLEATTRRIIVLASTCALGRWDEFELHLRAALTAPSDTRLSQGQVKEVLIQLAVYAGVPAANTAMGIAVRLLKELGFALAPASIASVVHPATGRIGRSASTPALHYSVHEPRNGLAPRQTIVLSHALGCDLGMWDGLALALSDTARVICYDHRGHGSSEAPAGPYTLAEMVDDAERLLIELQTGPIVWVGLSLGGMVGQELALRHPQRVVALAIANATSGYDREARILWEQRIAIIEMKGLEAIADGAMQRWFSDEFRASQPATVARWRRRVISTPVVGYLGACVAVMNVDTTPRLRNIGVPTLVIAGGVDQGTPVAMSKTIAEVIPGAELVVIDGAAHLSVIEQPAAFEQAVRRLLARV